MRRRGAGLSVLVLLLATAPAACKGSDQGTRDLHEGIPKLVANADGFRQQGLARAAASAVPRPDLGPCPAAVHALGGGPSPPQLDDEQLGLDNLGIAEASEVAEKPGPLQFRLKASLRSAPSSNDGMTATRLSQRASDGQDFELIIDEEVAPRIAGGNMEPARLSGRFYVWDYGKRAVVCAANVAVEATPEPTLDAAALATALRHRAIESARGNLYVAGPRLGPETGGGVSPK